MKALGLRLKRGLYMMGVLLKVSTEAYLQNVAVRPHVFDCQTEHVCAQQRVKRLRCADYVFIIQMDTNELIFRDGFHHICEIHGFTSLIGYSTTLSIMVKGGSLSVSFAHRLNICVSISLSLST